MRSEKRDPDACEHRDAAKVYAHVPDGIAEGHGFARVESCADDIAGGPNEDAPEGGDGHFGHVGQGAETQGAKAEVGGGGPARLHRWIGDLVPDGNGGEAPAQPEERHGPCGICEDKERRKRACDAGVDRSMVDAAQEFAMRVPRGEMVSDGGQIGNQRAERINSDSKDELWLKRCGSLCDQDAASDQDQRQPGEVYGEVGVAVGLLGAGVGCGGHRVLWDWVRRGLLGLAVQNLGTSVSCVTPWCWT